MSFFIAILSGLLGGFGGIGYKISGSGKVNALQSASVLAFFGVIFFGKAAKAEVPSEIQALLDQRAEARKAKNWAESDRIRDELKAQGIIVEDTPQGMKWKRA